MADVGTGPRSTRSAGSLLAAAHGPSLRFCLLGELEVWNGDHLLPVRGGRPRRLLLSLLLRRGETVPADVLIDQVWGTELPASPTNALHVQVAYLRRVFDAGGVGREVVSTRPGGYCLAVRADELDVVRFEQLANRAHQLADAGRAGLELALQSIDEALALWRGGALADVAEAHFALGEAARLEELRLSSWEYRAEILLALGRSADAVAQLRPLVAAHPLRERLHAELMLALYREGRQADALRVCSDARRVLAEELGLEPGPQLRDLERRILAHDPGLAWRPPDDPAVPATPASPAPATSRFQPEGPEAAPLVGRREELARLRAALERRRSGRGTVLLVDGEAGIGKTRLLEALRGLAADTGEIVAVGRCFEGGGAPALWPWIQIVRQLVDRCGEDRVMAAAGRGAVDLVRLVPELGDDHGGPGVALDPEAARFRVFDAIATVLRHLSDTVAAVALDDLHGADADSLRALTVLAETLESVPILLVGTYRSGEVRPSDPLADALADLTRHHAQRMALAPLPPDHISPLIALVTGSRPSPTVAQAVYRRTDGNPFFTVELARLLEAEGALQDEVGVSAKAAIPAGVQDVLRRRLAGLSPPAARFLAAGAVAGRDFDLDVAAAVCGLGEDEALDVAEEGFGLRLLEQASPPGRLRFSHVLVAEAIVGNLNPLRRSRLHRSIAEVMDRLHPHDPFRYAEIAHHVRQATLVTDRSWAVPLLRRCAQHATTCLAFAEAERLHRERLDLVRTMPTDAPERRREELDALVDLSVLWTWTKGYQAPEVEAAVSEALARVDATSDATTVAAALYARWAYHTLRCQFDVADQLVADLVALASRYRGGIVEFAAHLTGGIVAWHRGRVRDAARAFAAADALLPAVADTAHARVLFSIPPVALGCFTSANTVAVGQVEEGQRAASELVRLARGAGHSFSVSFALLFQALGGAMAGDVGLTMAAAGEAVRLATAPGFRHTELLARALLAWARARDDPSPEGPAALQASIDELEHLGALALGHLLLGLLADALLHTENPVAALAAVDAGLGACDRTGEALWLAELHRLRGTALRALGSDTAAIEAFDRAALVAREQGMGLVLDRLDAAS